MLYIKACLQIFGSTTAYGKKQNVWSKKDDISGLSVTVLIIICCTVHNKSNSVIGVQYRPVDCFQKRHYIQL